MATSGRIFGITDKGGLVLFEVRFLTEKNCNKKIKE